MNKYIVILACSLLAIPALAQSPNTLAFLDQIQGRLRSTTPMLLLMTNGKVTGVQIDSSLVLNLSTNPPTLSAASARFPTPNIETFAITLASSTITLAFTPVPNTLACYRNGMRLSAGFDYTQAAAVLTFLQGVNSNSPQANDLFTCDYQH